MFNGESRAAAFIRAHTAKGTTVHADEAHAWEHLHERFEVKRIDHQEACACAASTTKSPARLCFAMRRNRHGGG